MPASAAAQQPTAEGRIGVSLVIPPRITLETSPDDAAAFCSRISGGAELLAIVDRSGHLVPACGTMGATTAKTRNGLRAVLVGPI
ncbi:MAG TPA: hypothetical protein VLA56_11590 [Pseudomonadales bacterium]|nr:hypothetical protein [Pseudomonadales bacterium]